MLPAKQGGLGLLSAEGRAAPAFLSSWAAAARDVAGALGLPTGERFRLAATGAVHECEQAWLHYSSRGCERPCGTWEDWLAKATTKLQKALHSEDKDKSHARLLESATREDKADIRSAGGVGQSWAATQVQVAPPLADPSWAVVTRRRLRVQWPAGRGDGTCKHRRANGTFCGAPLDARGTHALTCNCGGGVDRRHNRLRDVIAAWLKEQGHEAVDTEVQVPQWRRQRPNGTFEDARLDITFRTAGVQLYADVVVASPVSEDAERAARRARTDGATAEAAEKEKRQRYPHPNLAPLAVETLGRLGAVSQAFARRWATRDPLRRPAALASFYGGVAAALQQHNADMLQSSVAA